MRKSFLLITILGCLTVRAWSQRICGTMDHLQMQLQQDPSMAERMQQIETFTSNWIANNPGGDRSIVTIPVVVHVVYKTTAQNISDAKVQAQIDQLNADYARLNSDAGNTPSAFLSVAANCEVQFCLAQRDPSGNATNGIIHKLTTANSFSDNDNIKKNANGGDDAWDRSSYLNIWTGKLSGGLLGYAQFPGGPAATDGVVVLYSSVGSIASPGTEPDFNFGRSATHEVGHWLNLFHIWGDDGNSCNGSDLVADTPNQADETFGCPAFPHTSCSNTPNGDMFMNFMDYTDDACMNIFTAGQKSRMQALFVSGGSRFSITTSQGCVPPAGCGVPTGLNATLVTSSSATLNWSSVSGATSYNAQYRPTGNPNWTAASSSSTSVAISSLLSSTQYEFQVQAVCSGGNSVFSASTNFTTSAGGGCTDVFEPNESKNKAKAITVGVSIQALISSATDKDFFSFANSSGQPNIKITVTNLAGDYDVKLFNAAGTKVASSQNSGTGDENCIFNNAAVGTYKPEVFSFGGDFSTTQCYTLTALISSTPFKLSSGDELNPKSLNDLSNIYPNPSIGRITVEYNSATDGDVNLVVFDLMGRMVHNQMVNASEGFNSFNLSYTDLQPGTYMLQVINGSEVNRMKFEIAK